MERAGADWELVSELSSQVRIPSGKHYSIWFDNTTGGFMEMRPYPLLSTKARQAVNMTPSWIRGDLERTFLELGNDMDRYANVITGASDPRFVDEMAFTIAHTSPDVLRLASSYPGMFAENAASIYAADANLSYVRLVEKTDHTTAAYINASGAEVEIPRDIYYWFIVHPKVTDERPTYIDPASGQPAAPPTGKFWRDYLMNHNDSGYPLLRETLSGVPTLWNGTRNSSTGNGAVGAIIRWILDVMDFGSGTERPVQPVRIYDLHLGRCGEHEDITCAAARAALIPCIGCDDLAEDHVWNEFWYDGRWVQIEPVNNMVDSPNTYAGWGKKFPAVTAWRGDDFAWQETGIYTQTCTLCVTVKDSLGRPVEGATVWVGNELSTDNRFRMIASWNSTNASGMAEFCLGKNNTIYARVDSEKLAGAPTASPANTGANPYVLAGTDTVKVITDALPIRYNYTFTLANAAILKKNSYTQAGTVQGNYKLEIVLKAQDSEVVGKNLLVGSHYFTQDVPVPVHSFFASDEEYLKFNSSQGFKGWGFSNATDVTDELSVPDNGGWRFVIGSDATSAIQSFQLTARFYVRPHIIVRSPVQNSLLCEGRDMVISGMADAADAAKVELSFDGGKSWKDGNFNASARTWRYLWNTSGLASGNYSVMSRLLHGTATATAEPLTVIIDADDPVVRAPEGGILKGGGSIHLSGNVSDNVGIATVGLSIEGSGHLVGGTGNALSSGNTSWDYDWRTDQLSSGDYSVTVRATDLAGRMGLVKVNITLDFEPPTVTFSTTGLFRGGQAVRLEGTVSDNIRLDGVTILGAGNDSGATVENGRWRFDWNTTGLASRKYMLTAFAEDNAGWNSSASSTITLDADAPMIDIDWPETAEAGTMVALAGNLRDEKGLAMSEICTDGENWTELLMDEYGDWTFDWDTSALMPGNFSISVRANDTVGNVAQTTNVISLEDTTAPVITIDVPKVVEFDLGYPLKVSVKILDRTGIKGAWISVDGGNSSALIVGPKEYFAYIDTSELKLGKHKIMIDAEDMAGNHAKADKDFSLEDISAPTLSIKALNVDRTSLMAIGTASDDYGIKEIQFTLDGNSFILEIPYNGTASRSLTVSGYSTVARFVNETWDLSIYKLKPGTHSLMVKVTDRSGKASERTGDFEISAPRTAQNGFPIGLVPAIAVLVLLCALSYWFLNGRLKSGKG
jgi:hypothetical protein